MLSFRSLLGVAKSQRTGLRAKPQRENRHITESGNKFVFCAGAGSSLGGSQPLGEIFAEVRNP